jgi:1,4-alpha-glucan branching enzyme
MTTMNTKKTKSATARTVTAVTEAVKSEPTKNGSKDGRILLELIKPDAKNVAVAGTFNEWNPQKTPLSPLGNGRWAGDLKVKAGRYEYLFVVDGQWLPDPNAKESVQNPYGGKNSVLVVST